MAKTRQMRNTSLKGQAVLECRMGQSELYLLLPWLSAILGKLLLSVKLLQRSRCWISSHWLHIPRDVKKEGQMALGSQVHTYENLPYAGRLDSAMFKCMYVLKLSVLNWIVVLRRKMEVDTEETRTGVSALLSCANGVSHLSASKMRHIILTLICGVIVSWNPQFIACTLI